VLYATANRLAAARIEEESPVTKRRGFGLPNLAMAVAVALAACGGSPAAPGAKAAFSIYFVSDLTGVTAAIGQPMSSGSKAYIDWTNKQGGVNGHKINLTILDDGQDVNKVKLDIQQAANAGALGILGANSSNGWSPNAPQAAANQISIMGLGFTDPQIEPAQPYLYSLSPSYIAMSTMDFNFIKEQLIKNNSAPANPKIAFYHYTSAAVSTMIGFYKQLAQPLGWQITTDQQFAQNATDVSSQATAIANSGTDVVIANLIDSLAPLAVKALREKGFKGPIVNFTGASSPATFAALKDPGYYSLRAYLATTDISQPGVQAVVDHAKAVGGTEGMANLYWSYGWVNAAVMLAGVKKCGDSCDKVKLNTALDNLGKVDVNGLNPDVQLTPTQHRTVTTGLYFHWDSGKSQEVPQGTWVSGK
jgi:branched-chain amino acid transport system substrate-binding protein